MSVKCLIYCSKAKPRLFKHLNNNIFYHSQSHFDFLSDFEKENILNGKIVASFDCEKVEKIIATKWSVGCGCAYYHFETKDLLRKSCLEYGDLCDYLENQNGYAIHISNLEIFDKPKELSEYCVIDNTVEASSKYRKEKYGIYGNLVEKRIFKAPQNMQVAFENGILTEHPTNFSRYKYVLISIKPEWVAKILNGQKTIEVRRVVTNKLKKLIGE